MPVTVEREKMAKATGTFCLQFPGCKTTLSSGAALKLPQVSDLSRTPLEVTATKSLHQFLK